MESFDEPEKISSDIPRDIEELLVDIKFIANLPTGHKYDIESQAYSHSTSLFSRLFRTVFTREDKEKSLGFINKTVSTAIEIMKRYPTWKEFICEQLCRIGNAVTNLKHVYASEPKFVARLETLEIKLSPVNLQRTF